MRFSGGLAALTLSAMTATACFGDITGKVSIKGKVPEMKPISQMQQIAQCAAMHNGPVFEQTVVTDGKGGLANVVVYVRGVNGAAVAGDALTKPVTLDQKGCMYDPHVIAAMVNQPIVAKNSDALLHNVHTMPFVNNAENFAMVMVGTHKMGPYTSAESFMVKCDVHPWMQAYIVVVDNPFFAVSGKDGSFTINTKGLKDGDYEIVFWQEKYGEQSQKLSVKDGKATSDYTFDADAKPAAQAPATSIIKLAALDQSDGDKACCAVDGSAKVATAADKR